MNGFNVCFFHTWQCSNFIAYLDASTFNLSLESTELMIWTTYSLYRKVKTFFLILININLL